MSLARGLCSQVTDANLLHEPVWREAAALAQDKQVWRHNGTCRAVCEARQCRPWTSMESGCLSNLVHPTAARTPGALGHLLVRACCSTPLCLQALPAAHRGFLARARAIHIEQLYELAVSSGRRLVLCGHSLGGAVAKLCTLR